MDMEAFNSPEYVGEEEALLEQVEVEEVPSVVVEEA